MEKWLIKFLDKIGLDTSNLKPKEDNQRKVEGITLKYGQTEQVYFPSELAKRKDWVIDEWLFKIGQKIQPGDIVCIIKSKKISFEFESFIGGTLTYTAPRRQKLRKGTLMLEMIGNK